MSDSSSYIVYTYTQPDTPSLYSSYLSYGPSNAVLQCQPSPRQSWSLTLWWYATTNGCPNGYSYSTQGTSASCVYTSQLTGYFTFTWKCDFTVSALTTSTVDGGPTTVQNGAAVTVAGATTYATVTQTAQVTSLQVSIYNPNAVTIVVTSTVTVQTAAAKRRDQVNSQPAIQPAPLESWTPRNVRQVELSELFKRVNNFNCPGTNLYCKCFAIYIRRDHTKLLT
jgi:hypothetical protein